MTEDHRQKGLQPLGDSIRTVLLFSKAPQPIMLLPESVNEKPGQPDEDQTETDADRVNEVQKICILLCPEVQIGWVHVDSSKENINYTDSKK
jgi:hypothetical protein